jgi:tripartite-type tricarboxylate transporter receptor subunit TctC
MKPFGRRAIAALLAALPLLAATAAVQAQHSDYPNRPVRIIVAYPPGQSTDIATRYFANKLTQALGQSFIVENKPGASGNIGTAYAAKATPDGYTLIMGANGTHAINPALFDNTGFDADKDFDAIAMTALIPFAISVGPAVPVNTLPELIALARSKPGKVDVAIPSVTGQLVLEMLKARDVPLFAVKHKGSADSMTNVLGGHVPVLIDTVAATRTQLGKIKVLAVTTETPMDSMPGIKTAGEQGLKDFQIAAWNALMVPRGVPADIQARLYTEMTRILALPETRKALADLGFAPAPTRTPPQLTAWLAEERRNYAQIIKTAKMKAD